MSLVVDRTFEQDVSEYGATVHVAGRVWHSGTINYEYGGRIIAQKKSGGFTSILIGDFVEGRGRLGVLKVIANVLLALGASLIVVSFGFVITGNAIWGIANFFLPGLLYCLIALFVVLISLFVLDRSKVCYLYGAAGCALMAPFVSVTQGLMMAASLGLRVNVYPSLSVIGWWSGSLWALLRGGDRQEPLTLGFDVLSVAAGLVLLNVALILSLRKGKHAGKHEA